MAASAGVSAATYQSMFREVNERIAQLSASRALGDRRLELMCECADDTCSEPLFLMFDEYEQVRAVPTHFIVIADHVLPEVERVIRESSDYVVVEKIGDAGATAEQLDPRRHDEPSRP